MKPVSTPNPTHHEIVQVLLHGWIVAKLADAQALSTVGARSSSTCAALSAKPDMTHTQQAMRRAYALREQKHLTLI
jgi:hypothetical protein